jgi:hypothetical protein
MTFQEALKAATKDPGVAWIGKLHESWVLVWQTAGHYRMHTLKWTRDSYNPWLGHQWHCDPCNVVLQAGPDDPHDQVCPKCTEPMRYDFPEPVDAPYRCFHCGRRTKQSGYDLEGGRHVPPTCLRTPCMDALSEHWTILLNPAN